MKNNKSIDGLVTRSAKKPSTPSKPAVAKAPAAKTPVQKTAPVKKTPAKPAKKVSVNQSVDDFLSPVQAFDFNEETGELTKSDKTKKELKAEKKANKKLEKAERKAAKKAAKLEKNGGKKSHKVRNIIASIFLVLVLAASGVVIWAVFWGNDIIAKITGGQGNVFDLFTFMDENYQPLKTDANGRTNILAIGTSGINMDGDEGRGTHAGSQLTDSIMAISLNQDTGDIVMVSFPRDLKASRTCTATGKINEIYWCNGGGGSASIEQEAAANQAVMNEIGSILGLEFQYFAHLNWGSLKSIVDTLGGITIRLDEGIYDKYWTGAVYEPNVDYQIDGTQAVGLSRARHGTTGGDFSRGASQQKILIGIKNKLVEKHLSIPDLVSLAGTLGDNLRSNFSVEDLKTLAHLLTSMDLDSMRQAPLYDTAKGIYYMKTANINGISYVIPSAGVGNYSQIQAYIARMTNNDPRVYEEPKIAVLNATGEDGVAAEQKTKMEEDGYTVTTIDNIEGNFEDYYTLYDISSRTPGTRTMLKEYFAATPKSGDEIPANVPRDYDLVVVLGPSPAQEEEPSSSEEEQ